MKLWSSFFKGYLQLLVTFTQHVSRQDHSLSEKIGLLRFLKMPITQNICKCDTYCKEKRVIMSEKFSNGRLNLKQKQSKALINVESFYCWFLCLLNPCFGDCLRSPVRNKYISLLMIAICVLVCSLDYMQ